MAPLVILHRASLPLVAPHASSSSIFGGHPAKQLAAFVGGAVMGGGRAVYGAAIDMVFEVASVWGAEYGDAFMEYYLGEMDRAAKQVCGCGCACW